MQHIQRTIRRQQREFIRSWQRQYHLRQAWHDLRAAVQRNEDIFLGYLLGSLLLGYAFAAVASQLLFFSFQSVNGVSQLLGLSMGLLSVLTAGVLLTVGSWCLVLVMNGLCLAVQDGANRKQLKSLRSTARRALRATPRVSLAWLLAAGSAGLGVALTALPFGLYAYSNRHNGSLPAGFIILTAVALAAALYEANSLLLAPHVALHEPSRPLLETLPASRRLLQRRGRLFMFFLTVSLFAALLGSWQLSDWLQQLLHYHSDLAFYLLAIVEVVVINLFMTVLYRKRKLARPATVHASLRQRRLALRLS